MKINKKEQVIEKRRKNLERFLKQTIGEYTCLNYEIRRYNADKPTMIIYEALVTNTYNEVSNSVLLRPHNRKVEIFKAGFWYTATPTDLFGFLYICAVTPINPFE